MIIKVAKGGSMTIDLYSEWLNEVLSKRHRALFNQPSLLLDEQARSHKGEGKNMKNVTPVFIPSGCTPILQP